MTEKRRQMLWLGLAAALGLGASIGWQTYTRRGQLNAAQLDALWSAEFDDPAGEVVALKRFQGKPLVVNFWATWCPPCIEEMPLLDAFFQKNQANGWQMLGLAIDQPSQVRRFLTQKPVSYPIGLAGLNGPELARQLGNESGALPFTLVLDAGGEVIQAKLGKLSEEDIQSWTKS
jgi:thiol-disulfide isomerase/thioredoxin